MLRFLLLTLTLCLGCALIIGAAIAVGRTQPPSEAVRWFHMDDCEKPCLMGIQLGKTTFAETRGSFGEIVPPPGYIFAEGGYNELGVNTIAGVYTNKSNSEENFIVRISYSNDDKRAAVVELLLFNLNSTQVPPTLGDIVMLYGRPKCAYFDTSSNIGTFVIVDNMRGVTTEFHADYPFDWSSRIFSLSISPSLSSTEYDECRCGHWHGMSNTYPEPDFTKPCDEHYR